MKRTLCGSVVLVAWTGLAGAVQGQPCGQWSLTAHPVFEGQPVFPPFISPLTEDHAIGVMDLPSQSGERVVLITEWNISSWTNVAALPLDLTEAWDVRAAVATGPDDVWVAGLVSVNIFNSHPFLSHWDGQGWQSWIANIPDDPNPQGGDPVRTAAGVEIVMYAPDDIWVICQGQDLEQSVSNPVACHFDGSNLDEVGPIPAIFSRLSNTEAGAGSAPNDAWIVGEGRNNGSSFQLFTVHWDGSAWTPMLGWNQLPGFNVVQSGLYDVASFAPNDTWAVGSKLVQHPDFSTESMTLYLHWDGSSWTEVPGPNIGPAWSMAGSASNDIWASCPFGEYGGRLAHWDGSSWTEVPSAPVPPQATHIGLTWLSSGPLCASAWLVGYWAVYDGAGGWAQWEDVIERLSPTGTSGCPGDVDSSGVIDVADIAFTIFRLGQSGPVGTVEGDADANGVVDVNDVAFIVFRLGGTCA